MRDKGLGILRFHAPYMEWAKKRPSPRFDLAGSNVMTCTIDELPGARDAIGLAGQNENGYAPLLEAIATRYGVSPGQVTTAQGASGANFLVCAALLEPGDDVLVERPGYDPLLGAPRLMGANIIRFDRRFEDGFVIDPDAIAAAMTPRTRLVIISSPHNPSGIAVDHIALEAVGRLAETRGAHVLVDEVYLDAAVSTAFDGAASPAGARPAARISDVFLSTSSLTKSYGLSGLRCGWILSSASVAERLRRARDVVDGTGPIVTERLGTLAFTQLDRLIARSTSLLNTNARLVRSFLNERSELHWLDPVGGTVMFPRLREVADTSTFAERLLNEHETAIVPGRFFEAPQHFRLGFGGPTDALKEGLRALSAALDARAW